ncbi:sugar phosphate isomerase/epimerase family protein [Paenibacillus nasutitermitis]|uniref:Xylose isomerase-like TIM barrel domain-containing protein n=1 Tax=Paenibacillus nasutitermitis TaxID=1652958 RepID=A0A916ZC33_9BACL|nr:sugar phosphate isomerase/epimerase family protein [Paenibacillus nasutitermitis]GGD85097.1 hypothetical protein GCM10010911_49370 [Paenibacillus nasutitermitis]
MQANTLRSRWPLGMSVNAAMPPNLRQLADDGIDCIEVTWRAPDTLSGAALAECDRVICDAERHGIRVWSLHLPYGDEWDPSSPDDSVRESAVAGLTRLIDFACDRNVRTTVIHPSFEPIAPEAREARLRLASRSLGALARHAAGRGVRLAAECLPRTCLAHSAAEMLALLHDNPELWVCVDVNHLFRESPAAFIRAIGSRLATTHLSDNGGIDEEHRYPGDGIIDWPDVLRALEEVCYDGPAMYEVRGHTPDRVRANWNSLLHSKEVE